MAKRDGLVSADTPTKPVKVPKFDNKRLRFLGREEAENLLANLKERSQQVHDMALLSLHCGLRAGEIFNLCWGDVDVNRGTLTLRNTKSGKTRTAYMTERVKNIFTNLVREDHDALVFPDRNGMKIKDISHAFDRAVDELALNNGISDPRQKAVFHTLRHTFASWLVENGTDLFTVKELMGHSTLVMSERYIHVGQNALQAAVRNLDISLSKNWADVVHLNSSKV
jgi:integrase